MVEFRSADDGDTKQLRSCEAPSTLYLKLNAKVFLMVNLTDNLVNGSRGIVKDFTKDSVTVFFESIKSTVTVRKHLFTVYDINLKREVASRKQIPLKLAYAFTVHKAQGMTLEHLEVDCRNMNFPGQLGVAIGRAVSVEGLRVLNYGKCHLRKQPVCIDQFYSSESESVLPGKNCCKKEISNISSINIPRECELTYDSSDSDPFDDEGDEEIMKIITNTSDADVQLGEMTELPTDLELASFIELWMYKSPVTQNQVHLNEDLQYLLMNIDATYTFSKELWSVMRNECQKILPNENERVENRHIINFHKAVTQFIGTEVYKILVAKMFSRIDITSRHFRAAYSIVEELRKRVIQERTREIIQKTKDSIAEGKQFKSSNAGRAKIRYIAGWCVASLKNNKRKYVKRNLYKKNNQGKVNLIDKEIRFLEELVVSEEEIFEKSTEITSLIEIQRKQNIRHGLTNVTDACFEFFIEMDKKIRDLETLNNLTLYTSNIYSFISAEISESESINQKWRALFTENENFNIISSLFHEILSKYLKMSSNQFIRECN